MQIIYSNFIEDIIKNENLIDIGRLGKASQSSLSKWSKENDAQRAVDGSISKDFSFHTGKELNPWWQVEFDKPINVEYIIINNRKQEPFDEIASDLRIVAYDGKGIETLIHQGKVFFGSELEGCPLIIPLKSKISFKKLRITLLNENYLHLSNIRFLIADPLKSFAERPVFIANRRDGLGERLRALLNSMVLAKEFDGHFIFSWPLSFSKSGFHAIDKSENIFSSDFIESHLVTRDMLNRCEIKDLRDTKNFTARNNNGYKKIGINLDQTSLNNQIKDKNLQLKNLSSEYKLAFENINFNEGVTKSINLARSVQLKDKVLGIHLRTGDIVHGQYRYLDRYYSKVVPFYVLDALIMRHLELGYGIVLFSQDNETCQYFKDKYGVLLSNDLVPKDYDDIQRAIFDIVLMSRCAEIVGGSSGFAILASWIGDSKILKYTELLSKEEVKFAFMDSLEGQGVLSSSFTPPLLKSFSISHYLQSFRDMNSLLERIDFLEKCIEIDPTNNFYRLLLALDYYKKNNFKKADEIVLEIVNSKELTDIYWLAKTKFPKVTILSKYIAELKKYSKQGSVIAAYVAFLGSYYSDYDQVDTAFYQEILQKSEENKLGVELLKEALQRLN